MKTIKIIILGILLITFFLATVSIVNATITYTAGTNLITLDDSAGAGDSWGTAYTMENVLADCGAVVTKQGANAYDVSARMCFLGGVYFVSKDEFVELKPNPTNPSYTIRTEVDSHLQFGDYNSVDKYSYNGAFWRIYVNANSGSQTNRINGEFLVYGSNIWTDTGSYPKGIHFVAGAKIRLYSSIHEHPSYFWAEDCDVQDVKWLGTGGSYDMLVASAPNFAWGKLTTMGCQKGIFFSSTTTGSVDVYDFAPLNAGTDVFVSTGIGSDHLIRIINSPLAITCNNPGSGKQGVQFCYTFNVKVTNSNGDGIVGATVSLKDVDGNDAFPPENTVAGGVLTSDKIVKWYWFRHANDGGNKDYNDHTLKVIYGAEETEYKIKIDHQISEDIVLIPQSVASYDNIMAGINDMKGGSFAGANDSLHNISNKIDTIYPSLTVKASIGAFYSLDTDMAIFIIAQDENNNLTSATINVSIYYPNGTLANTGDATLRTEGRYNYTFRIPSDAPLGTYQVNVNASNSNGTAHDTTSFLTSANLPFIIEDDGTIIIKKSGFGLMALFTIPSVIYYIYKRRKKKR